MSHAANSVSDALVQLGYAVSSRLPNESLPPDLKLVRTPVALMFVRGNRAGRGDDVAQQVVSSFGYWNRESAKYLDLVFFGWCHEQGGPAVFQDQDDSKIFRECVAEVEGLSKWRNSGEADVLLVDFEMPVNDERQLGPGRFSFRNCIPLPVEKMIAAKQVSSLDAFVTELVSAAKTVYDQHPLQASAFEISDQIGWTRGRQALWDVLKQKFLRDWDKVYNELRPFAVCNLEKQAAASAGPC